MSASQHLRAHLSSLNAFDRHKFLLHDLATNYGAGQPAPAPAQLPKTDAQLLKEAYQFLPDPDADPTDWRTQLAQRYYKRLFREYALADLSRYKEGKVGLRWRTRQEVVDGKGQFVCGSLRCDAREGLASFEVPFSYAEGGQAKQALVKVRVCARHAYKLNYKKLQSMERSARKEAKRARKEAKKRKRQEGSTSDEEVAPAGARAVIAPQEAVDDEAFFGALMDELVQ